jgi:hypothetical protein
MADEEIKDEAPTLTQSQLDDVIGKKTAEWKKRENAFNAQLLAEQAQRKALEDRVSEFERKGKSEAQLLAEESAKAQERIKALQGEVAQRDAMSAELRSRLTNREMDLQIQRMLAGTVHPGHAALLARSEIPGLSVDADTLTLTYIDPKTGLSSDPAKLLDGWLKANPHLLRAAPGGPPTRGATPPTTAPDSGAGPLDGIEPGAKQIAAAFSIQGGRR